MQLQDHLQLTIFSWSYLLNMYHISYSFMILFTGYWCRLCRLREERLQRITRYKTRLALPLPPVVDQTLQK